MHPRLSLPQKAAGVEVVKMLLSAYPALPVVNEDHEVVGIVSEYDILDALKEGRTIHEFSAESIMSCGHIDHADICTEPITVSPGTTIEELVDIFFSQRISIIPVVENKRLVGIVSRKNFISALAEEGFWPEHELMQRVKPGKGA
jgi:CBS domain-containing protein